MTWSNILKPPFLGVCLFDDRTRVTYCSNLVYSNEIQEINMSSGNIQAQGLAFDQILGQKLSDSNEQEIGSLLSDD